MLNYPQPKTIRIAAYLLSILFFTLPAYSQNQPWQVLKSTHFMIYYKNAPAEQVNELESRAERYYDSIAEEFGFNRFNFWTWDNRAKIYLYDNQEDYRQSTQSYGWSGGQVIINQKLIQGFAGSQQFLDDMLPHELAHIIFMEMVGANNPAVPLWLQEGVATYQQQNIGSVKADLADSIKRGDYLSLQVLSYFQVANQNDETVKLFYHESYSLVNYLIVQFGKDAFVEFCRSLRDNRNLILALRKVYSFNNLNEFEASWKNYILK
jgi:hypothetical protein